MFLPIKWMKEYLDIEVDTVDLSDRITLTGSHVESIIDKKQNFDQVIVGRISTLESHPSMKNLSVLSVDTVDCSRQIVTGAKNMKVGDYVALAIEGSLLTGGMTIQKADFKGIRSEGMLCSYEELGFEDKVIPKNSRDGILILKGEFLLGMDIKEALDLQEETIEFEITPNRPDCLSVIGMAREVAAAYDKTIHMPAKQEYPEVGDIRGEFNQILIQSNRCNRYVARVIRDVVIEDSPQWMQNYLMQAGMRPINNIVDITNFVMLELGQPLHAFDVDTLFNQTIIVRGGKEGEVLKTLDGEIRKLDPEVLIIADGEKPIGLAGIMGGFDSEITSQTKRILIESANFDKDSIRLTSKKYGLRTEASNRFEKGIPLEISKIAVDRVCDLIEKIGAGIVIRGEMDVVTNMRKPLSIELQPGKVSKLLGVALTEEEVADYLRRLEFQVVRNEGKLMVQVPYFRTDIETETDLIEEIGRLYGFHNIVPKPLEGAIIRGSKSKNRLLEDKVKNFFYAAGLMECTTYSFISPKLLDKIGIPDGHSDKQFVKILNPLGEDYSIMRPTLLPNMMEVLEKNNNYKVENLKVYEIGNVFKPSSEEDTPRESKRAVIGMYGSGDFYSLKDIVCKLFAHLGLPSIQMLEEKNHPTFHENRCAYLLAGEEKVGILGAISYDVLESYHLNREVYLAELDLEKIFDMDLSVCRYQPIPKYPNIRRDIALVVDRYTKTDDIEKLIHSLGEGLIVKVDLFDVYTGEQVAAGKKSMAYEIVYQSPVRTLIDEEINLLQENIINALRKEFMAELRI